MDRILRQPATRLPARSVRRAVHAGEGTRRAGGAGREREALRLGLRGKPDLVKPNEDEAAHFAGIDATRPDAAEAAAAKLLEAGAQLAVISLGARGALAVTSDARYCVSLPDADIVSALGSGDAMVAGLVTGAATGLDLLPCYARERPAAQRQLCTPWPGKSSSRT